MIKGLKSFIQQLIDGGLFQSAVVLALSFGHIHDLALQAHQAHWAAWLYPPSVDMLMVGGYRRILASRRDHESTKGGWRVFAFGTACSLAANVIDSWLSTHSALGVIVGSYPAVAAVVATTSLGHSVRRRASGQDAPVGVAAEAEVQEQDRGEQDALQAPSCDTPVDGGDPPVHDPRDTPGPDFSTLDAAEVLPAMFARITAGHPRDTFPSGEVFCGFVNGFLVSHGYPKVSHMTIRRAFEELA